MEFTRKEQQLLEKLYYNREHVELTIGVWEDGTAETVHLNPRMEEVPTRLIYPVGSIGKPFTASLLAKKISEGKISLEDSLSRYIPGLPEGTYPTIRRLATHHAGYGGAPFGFFTSLWKMLRMNEEDGILHINPFRGYPEEKDMLEILKNNPKKDKEYGFSYSNFSYGVLGYILGKLEGSDYYGAMHAYLEELGLRETGLSNSSMTGYDKEGDPCLPWQWERTDIIAPAGALLSSMDDLLKFAALNMEEDSYLSLCHQIHAGGEKKFDQGLAWRVKKGTSISYHSGNAGAFSCILAMDRKTKRAAAIGMNYALVDLEELAFALLEK